MLTSFTEQMPISMLEAMSVGVPVVASAVGEIPTILEGQGAGFVQDIGKGREAFACCGVRIARPTGASEKMGASARKLVVAQFQEKLMIRQRYVDLLESMTGRTLCEEEMKC